MSFRHEVSLPPLVGKTTRLAQQQRYMAGSQRGQSGGPKDVGAQGRGHSYAADTDAARRGFRASRAERASAKRLVVVSRIRQGGYIAGKMLARWLFQTHSPVDSPATAAPQGKAAGRVSIFL
jgi:hypothetical protein